MERYTPTPPRYAGGWPQPYQLGEWDDTDNGGIVAAFIPAWLVSIVIFLAAFGYVDSEYYLRSSERLKIIFRCLVIAGLAFFWVAIGMYVVHTGRHGMIQWYTDAVLRMWRTDPAGKWTMENQAAFNVTYAANSSTAARFDWTSEPVVAVAGKYGASDVPTATSVVFAVTLDGPTAFADSYQKRVGSVSSERIPEAGAQSKTINLSGFSYNSTLVDTVRCYRDVCTGCTKKTRTSSIRCSFQPGSAIRNQCAAVGGTWVPYIKYGTTCSYGDKCGTCTYRRFLQQLCYFVTPSAVTGAFDLSSKYGCRSPASSSNAIYAYELPGTTPISRSVVIRIRSAYDPWLQLRRLTDGSLTFPISTLQKYRVPADTLLAIALSTIGVALLLLMRGERRCLFSPNRLQAVLDFLSLDPEEVERRVALDDEHVAAAAPAGDAAGAGYGAAGDNMNNNSPSNRGDSDPLMSRQHSSSSMKNAKECVICLSSLRDRKLTPCQHHVACKECSQVLIGRPCPICRKPVTGHVYCSPDQPTFARFVQ